MFDLDLLNVYVDKGLISKQIHPTEDLAIYNYTNKAAYERVWDEVTTNCRGLILNGDGEIHARPFPKFFNLEEHSRSDIVFSKPFRIYEKLDGSLGIFYYMPQAQKWAIATRGSFTSDQATVATEIFVQKYSRDWTPALGTTPLVEIIYPSNRIVVDYGDMEDLVLLTVIDNKTGKDIPEAFWYGPRAKNFAIDADTNIKPKDVINALDLEDNGNNEGVVLVFDWPKDGPKTRIKVKLDEYKRLHRILTGVSTKTIWECLKHNEPMDKLLERVPDEFFDWFKSTAGDLISQFKTTKRQIMETYQDLIYDFCPVDTYDKIQYCKDNRPQIAEVFKKSEYTGLLFSLLDGKDIDAKVWDMIRPQYSKPFHQDIDG